MAVPVLLRPVGYWTSRTGDGLPDPRGLMSLKWERDRRSLIAAYLGSAAVLDTLDMAQTCIICGAEGGRRERTDGVWRWPETLAHYVAQHGVKLPDELVAHMEREEFRPANVNVKALRDHLAPSNPAATMLISKAAAAAALDDLVSPPPSGSDARPRRPAQARPRAPASPPSPASASPHAAPTPGTARTPAAPAARRVDELDDETTALSTGTRWTASVRGVPTKPQQITFDRPIVLGRDRTCDVVLEHSSVSRRHARLVPGSDRVIVQDLDSANGVWLKRKRCAGQVEVQDGEEVSLGQATITLLR